MRRMRFLVVALISFVVTLFGAFLSPSTWLHKSLALALCGLLSTNPALCTNNAIAATQSQEANATNPVKVETTLPSSLNSQRSRGRFSIASSLDSDKREVYSFFINGIQTSSSGYKSTKPLVEKLLNSSGVKPPSIYKDTYNFSSVRNGQYLRELSDKLGKINRERVTSGRNRLPNPLTSVITLDLWLVGLEASALSVVNDLREAAIQQLFSQVITPDGQMLVRDIVETIKDIDQNNASKAKDKCEDSKKSKFLIIAHSQGNYFANEITARLPKDIAQRTVILGISSFSQYENARNNGAKVKLISRDGDASFFGWLDKKVISGISYLIKKTDIITSNLPSLPKQEFNIFANHSLDDYLGNPTKVEYTEAANQAFSLASSTLSNSINFDSGNYEKKEDCPKRDKKTGSSYGDPHIVTFDGYRYSFQTVGEFTLVKSTDRNFEVQVRQSPVPGAQLSLNSAVAIRSGNSRIAIYGQSLPDSDTSTPIRVDGRPFPAQGGTLPNGTIIAQQGQGSYIIQTTSGEVVSVRKTSRNNLTYMDVNPSIPDIAGRYLGLLGNSNGNPKDDLQTRSGQVIETQSTYGQIAQTASSFIPGVGKIAGLVSKVENIVFDQLYKEFGNSWRISQADSLFDYKSGQNTDSYTDRGFPSSYRTLAMLTPAQVQTANAACQQAKVNPDQLEGCIFDVGFTGDSGFAETASQALDIVNTINQIIPNAIPLPQIPQLPIPFKIPGLPF